MSKANKTHKSVLRKILFTICIMLLALIGIAIVVLLSQQPKDLQISNVDIATISNGVYTGSADNGLVKATVSVEINDGIILNISILEHEQLLGKKAEKITESIIAQQIVQNT